MHQNSKIGFQYFPPKELVGSLFVGLDPHFCFWNYLWMFLINLGFVDYLSRKAPLDSGVALPQAFCLLCLAMTNLFVYLFTCWNYVATCIPSKILKVWKPENWHVWKQALADFPTLLKKRSFPKGIFSNHLENWPLFSKQLENLPKPVFKHVNSQVFQSFENSLGTQDPRIMCLDSWI